MQKKRRDLWKFARVSENALAGIKNPARTLRLVEVTGLEPAASCSQSKHSTKLSYTSSYFFYYNPKKFPPAVKNRGIIF